MARIEIRNADGDPGRIHFACANTNGLVLRVVFQTFGRETFPDAEITIDDAAGLITVKSCGQFIGVTGPGKGEGVTRSIEAGPVRLGIR